ncbi:hypothetical protein DFOLPJBN_000455 [Candidatus Liberibacter asiaticus]|nr:hypothetical protein FXW35_00735 [Candidatus Liberibacter asiaticus]KAE9516890.1 hypothetical protein FXW27_00660 [Candidatus Liberibacter asiaticus]
MMLRMFMLQIIFSKEFFIIPLLQFLDEILDVKNNFGGF